MEGVYPCYGRVGESCQNHALQAGTIQHFKGKWCDTLFSSIIAVMNNNLMRLPWEARKDYANLDVMTLLSLDSSPVSLRDSFS